MRDWAWKIAGAAMISLSILLLVGVLQSHKTQEEPVIQPNSKAETAKNPAAKKFFAPLSLDTHEKQIPSDSEVQAIVEKRNTENAKALQVFKDDGWEEVKIDDIPDERIVSLSPSLLDNREDELQTQIQSNSYSGEALDRLLEIVMEAKAERTRFIAIEALGRSPDAHAQELLIEAFGEISDDITRSQILSYMKPAGITDDVALFLAKQASNTELPDGLRRQAAFPLAMSYIIDEDMPGANLNAFYELAPEINATDFPKIVELIKTGEIR